MSCSQTSSASIIPPTTLDQSQTQRPESHTQYPVQSHRRFHTETASRFLTPLPSLAEHLLPCPSTPGALSCQDHKGLQCRLHLERRSQLLITKGRWDPGPGTTGRPERHQGCQVSVTPRLSLSVWNQPLGVSCGPHLPLIQSPFC